VNANTPVGTVTMLFTDIEGSTELLRSLGERYGDLVRDHHNLLRAVAAEHGGRVVDTQGDAFFFAFPTAKEALLAAVDAQRRLAEHVWPDGVQLRVRMGMHTGEPALGSEGYLGIDVVNAARICAAAHGGQLVVSETTRALVRSDPPQGIGFRDLGEHSLKGLEHAQRLYQVETAGLVESFPPLRTAAPEPAVVAGMEKRADALADRINAAVLSHVESTLQRALAGEPAAPAAPAATDAEEPMPAAGEIMKLSAVGLLTLLLLVVVVVVSIWLVKSIL
jgi:class 3 adenylate cyclase